MKNRLLNLFVLLLIPAISFAEVFTNEEYGYTIEVDDSFRLTRNDFATYFRSDDNDSVIVIKNWPGLDEEAARNYLQEGYQNDRIAIVAVSEPKAMEIGDGKGLTVDTRGVIERNLVKGMAGAFIGNGGQGIVVMLASPEGDWDKLAPMLQKATASIKFIELKQGPDARDWSYMLAGTRLSLRGTDTDRTQREDIYFCSDGSFKHRMSRTARQESDSGASFGFSGRNRSGSWQVVDEDGKSRLMMHYSGGLEKSFHIEDLNGQTYLDGQRYYMMRNSRCR